MMHRTSTVARVAVHPSRAGPSHRYYFCGAALALLAAAAAGAQTIDSAPPANGAANRTPPRHFQNGSTSSRSTPSFPPPFNTTATANERRQQLPRLRLQRQLFNLYVAELVVQIAAAKPNDAGFRVDSQPATRSRR